MKNPLLSVSEIYEADRRTIKNGTPGVQLMEAAGSAIAREIIKRWQPCKTVILCGPGNNGGDGFVVGRILQEKGWAVRILLLGGREKLQGDAKAHADKCPCLIAPLSPEGVGDAELIVDALFGAGLAREIDATPGATLRAVQDKQIPVVCVDTPSGVHGDSGAVLGFALQAELTVTFAAAKTGHYLMPGRALCGELVVADIGIPDEVIKSLNPACCLNQPQDLFPWPDVDSHKYHRGHGVIVGGLQMTGAARLAAVCARRVGAGLITIAAQGAAYMIYRQAEAGNLVSNDSLDDILADPRKNAVLVGPGLGIGEGRRAMVKGLLETDKHLVLDADALSMLAGHSWTKRPGETILTPHEGEFARLFPDLTGSKLERACQAASITQATILLKGPDTVIAGPHGQCAINASGTPWLATAGSGDSLSGICLGLLAQGVNGFDAACLGAWLHGKCAELVGPGLISEDISHVLPQVLKSLQK